MIKSTDREVRALIEALGSDEARREAAVARLIIIGSRAMARLITTLDSTDDRETHLAILRVLEAVGDDRALPAARNALAAGGDLAVQGVSVLVQLLQRGSLTVQEGALDELIAAAADERAERRVRLAATQAVDDITRDIKPSAARSTTSARDPLEAVWSDAADGHLPDDPRTLRAALAAQAEQAPLPILHRLIEVIRAREQAVTLAGGAKAIVRRDEWRAVRGALHQALALRGSRIALYDLRETIDECGEALPPSFMGALQLLGDASCLEPLAKAFSRAREQDDHWRHQLATTFHNVVRRERLTQRHAAMRRALARSPQLAR